MNFVQKNRNDFLQAKMADIKIFTVLLLTAAVTAMPNSKVNGKDDALPSVIEVNLPKTVDETAISPAGPSPVTELKEMNLTQNINIVEVPRNFVDAFMPMVRFFAEMFRSNNPVTTIAGKPELARDANCRSLEICTDYAFCMHCTKKASLIQCILHRLDCFPGCVIAYQNPC